MDERQQISRSIQEYVPGKQVTLAHLIANPESSLYAKLGVVDISHEALGILTITPSEAAIIAADLATKEAAVDIVFMDRFSGSVVVCGDVASVENALRKVIEVLCDQMGFSSTTLTRT